MSRPTSTRTRLGPDARREQIFACALRLFAEHDYSAVSTADIARAAGVARGLINHYFGTKRALYLEAVRALVTIPPLPEVDLPDGTIEERCRAGVDWFVEFIWRNRRAWISFVGFGGDADVQHIITEAEEVCAERVLEAVGLTGGTGDGPRRAAIRAFGGMVRAAVAEWLVRGALTRDHVRSLFTHCLLALVADVFPELGGAQTGGTNPAIQPLSSLSPHTGQGTEAS